MQVAVSLRATKTTSCPAQGPPSLRAASRRTRFDLLRTGAEPSFFPATKASLPLDAPAVSGEGRVMTITEGQDAFVPLEKILSMSCLDLTVFFITLHDNRTTVPHVCALEEKEKRRHRQTIRAALLIGPLALSRFPD